MGGVFGALGSDARLRDEVDMESRRMGKKHSLSLTHSLAHSLTPPSLTPSLAPHSRVRLGTYTHE